jgi:hypothetical protein
METTISLRGVVSAVSTIYVNRREYHTFLLNDDENGTYRVYVRYEDMDYTDMEDGDHFSANGLVVADGIMIATSVDRWGRVCDVCGKWHTEGYWIGEVNYACSEDCALHYYGGDKEAFEADLALLNDPESADSADTYWTSWD